MSDLRASIAAELAKHRESKVRTVVGFGCQCECQEPICTPDNGNSHDYHWREHVATVLTALLETELREARASAWDEGRDVGHEDTYLNLIEGRGDFDAAETPNPYRAEGPA